jgi:acetyl-CoA synthetase
MSFNQMGPTLPSISRSTGPKTLTTDIIDAWADRDDRIAVVAVDRSGAIFRGIRYSHIRESSNRFANAMATLNVRDGDVACVIMGRLPEWHTVLMGCAKLGVVALPGTVLLTSRDLAYRINLTGAKVVVAGPEQTAQIDAIRKECPSLTLFIVAGPAQPGWHSLSELLAAASSDTPPLISRQLTRPLIGYFTSGTTSKPKLVMRDHGYALAHAATGLFWMDLRPNDLHWTLSDTGWAKAAWGLLFPQLLLGTPMVLYDGAPAFDADAHLRLIEQLQVTTLCAPPTVYRLFAKMDLSKYDLSSIRHAIGAGEPLNPEAIRAWKDATGVIPLDGYGQTETINIVANTADAPVKYGSMGRPVPGYDVDIIDDDGNRQPNDQVGHIGVRLTEPWPPGLFRGYVDERGLDTHCFRNGWYYTGDTGSRDHEGYIWFVGRADDLITSAGYRISPFEVESILVEHPAVAESAVIGAPDEIRGEVVMAYVVLTRGYEPSTKLAEDLQEFCKANTAPYKYPRRIEFCVDLPKTVSGKIRRVELRQRARASAPSQ